MRTADYLIKKLEELGIKDFFGLPGDYNFNILYAINNNPNTNWIGCTNELNAGYCADGYARQNRYGAVVTTYGVGELSCINAIAGCASENIPVIHIVGTPSQKHIENKTLLHHNLNPANPKAYEDAFKNVVESTAFLNRDNAKLEIDRVLKIFIKEKKPVYIAIPLDVANMEISEKVCDYNWSSDSENLKIVIEKIKTKIKEAKKPVILGDVLVKRFNSLVEYREFVKKTKIPTTSFLMGSDLIPSDCPNYLGTYFAGYENVTAKKYLENTDCLISIGVIYSDVNSSGFNLPIKINSHIAIYGTYTFIENVKYENVKMSDVLKGLGEDFDSHNFDIEPNPRGYAKSEIKDNKLSCEYIFSRLQEFLRENDIIIGETGIVQHAIAKMKFPNNIKLEFQTLWGSIGWATPATLGACVANLTSRVILITGEGSHQLTAMEIGNMLRLGIKPVIIVLNNKGYTIERLLSDKFDDTFNDIVQINYSKFVRSFEGDIWSTKVETADDFDKALRVTQIMNKLCYIEVCIEKDDIPEISQKILTSFKNNKEKEIVEKFVNSNNKKEKLTLTKKEDMNFGTTVHESLRKD